MYAGYPVQYKPHRVLAQTDLAGAMTSAWKTNDQL